MPLKIEELLREATPGEWEEGEPYLDDGGQIEMPIRSKYFGYDAYPCACFLEFANMPGMQKANSKLIPALKNSAADLVALVKAVREYREHPHSGLAKSALRLAYEALTRHPAWKDEK